MGLELSGDVVVVGGGPAGLSCATELARRGFKTWLLEEHASVADKVLCTGIIGLEAFQAFALPREAIVGQLGPMKVMSGHGTELPYTPPQPLAYIVDKGAFNQGLAARATTAGVHLLTPPGLTASQSMRARYTSRRRRPGISPSASRPRWSCWPVG